LGWILSFLGRFLDSWFAGWREGAAQISFLLGKGICLRVPKKAHAEKGGEATESPKEEGALTRKDCVFEGKWVGQAENSKEEKI